MDQTIIDRIKKLLNLAKDDAAFDAEAESALRFARRLMLLHNVDESTLAAPKDAHEVAADEEYGTSEILGFRETMMAWEGYLAHAVANLVGTVKFYKEDRQIRRTAAGIAVIDPRTGRSLHSVRVTFYGPLDDTRDATILFREWSEVIASMGRLRYGTFFRGPGRAYADGFAGALFQKVEKFQAEEKILTQKSQSLLTGDEKTTALVVIQATALMEAKREKATEWLEEEKGIKLRNARGSSRSVQHDAGAYAAGRADGSRVDFSRTKTERLTG